MNRVPDRNLSLISSSSGGVISDRLLLNAPTLLGGEALEALGIVFAKCNLACPSCYRGSQHKDEIDLTVGAGHFLFHEVMSELEVALDAPGAYPGIKKIPYLTGGDPSMFTFESLWIANHFQERGMKIGIAHNGSSKKFAKAIARHLEYAAIDIKAATPEQFSACTGTSPRAFEGYRAQYKGVLEVLANNSVFVEVRMPIYFDTTYEHMLSVARIVNEYSGEENVLFFRSNTPNKYDKSGGPDWDVLCMLTEDISRSVPDLPIGCMEGFSLERRSQVYLNGALCKSYDPKGEIDFGELQRSGIAFHTRDHGN